MMAARLWHLAVLWCALLQSWGIRDAFTAGAQTTPDYSMGYFVSVYYMGSTANADCVSLSKTASPYFSAMLIGACLPQRGMSPGATVVGGMMTTLSGSSATTTYYTDMTCTTPSAPYATLTFLGTTVSGSTTVTIDYNPGYLRAGLSISGTGIPTGAMIVSMSSSTAFTLSASATASTAAGAPVTLSTSVQVNGNTCNGAGCPSTLGVCTADNGMSMRTFVSATVPDLGTYYASYYASYFYVSADECNAASTKVGYVSVSTGGLCVSRGSYNALLSCPTTGAGGAVVTAKAASDNTCTDASINVPGQTTTSYTESVCQQSTTYVNGQNISPPLFTLPLLSACGSYGRPTPSPTPVSMLPPGGTAPFSSGGLPTAASPTAASPTGRDAVLYRTWHVGKKCVSSATIYDFYGGYVLGQCSRPDAIDPKSPHKYVCNVGANKYSLNRLVYDEFDPSCAQAPIQTALVSHDFMCRRDASTGYYVKTHCDSLPQALLSPTQLVVRSFDDNTCAPANLVTPLQTRNVILGACQPVYYLDPLIKGRKKAPDTGEILYYRKISYVSGPLGRVTWDQGVTISSGASGTSSASVGVISGDTAGRILVGSNTTAGSTLTLMVSRFKFLDTECQGETKMYVQVQYTIQAASSHDVLCRPDPLFPGKFYRVAAAATPSQAPSASPTNPTFLPTVRPSPNPSCKPSPRPSARPTTVPSPKPSANPTIMPTGQPTSRPSSLYDTAQGEKAVVKALWQGLGSFTLGAGAADTQGFSNWDFSPAGQAGVCGPLPWARINCMVPTVLSFYPTEFYTNFAPLAGNLLATIPVMPSVYSVSIDVYMTSVTSSWSWIASLTQNANEVIYMPGFRVNQNSVYILYQNHNSQVLLNSAYAWPLNTWVTISTSIDFINQLTTLKLTGGLSVQTIKAFEQTSSSPTPLSGCQVYASGAANWSPPFAGYIANFIINLAPPAVGGVLPVTYYPSSTYPSGIVSSTSNLLDAINLPTYYTLSFDFFQPAAATGIINWNSLVALYAPSTRNQGIPTVGFVPSSSGPTQLFVDYGDTFKTGWLYLPIGSSGVWSTATIVVDTVAYRVTATIKQGTKVVSKSATMRWGGRGAIYSGVGVWTTSPQTSYASPTGASIRNVAVSPGDGTSLKFSPTLQVNWPNPKPQLLAFDMASSGLVGTITSSLGRLKTLQLLNFDQNSISGKIPSALATMSRVESLIFGGSRLTGTLPTFLVSMPNLHYIDFNKNSLSGKIPPELGLFRGNYLNLAGNKFVGTIPMTLGKMTQFAGPAYGVMAAPAQGIFTFSNGQPLAQTTPYGDLSSMSSLSGCVPYAISGFNMFPLLTVVANVGSAASLSVPQKAVSDCAGNLYITQSGGRITRIASGGTGAVTLLNVTSARPVLNDIRGIAVDRSGSVYVAEYGGSRIRKIKSTGNTTTLGTSASPAFSSVNDVALDAAGNILVADTGNSLVRRIDAATGAVTSVGTSANPIFSQPRSIALDAAGNIFVADYGNSLIRKIDAVTGIVTSVGASAIPAFNQPQSVAVDPYGNIFVTEGTNRLRRIDVLSGAVTSIATSATFSSPWVSTDSVGNVFVTNSGSSIIQKISSVGSTAVPSCSAAPIQAFTKCSDQDYLRQFYAEVKGTPALERWNFDTSGGVYINPVCSPAAAWTGISCSPQGQVSSISLAGLNLNGTLPLWLFVGMRSLTSLDLHNNFLRGTIGESIKLFPSLTNLDLSSNQISGQLPTSIGALTQIVSINLNSNKLVGPIPFNVSAMAQLRTLDLSANSLTGTVPPGLCSLTALGYLDLSNNRLGGFLPAEIGLLYSIATLRLDANRFTGTLPAELETSPFLSTLTLQGNFFNTTGCLPASMQKSSLSIATDPGILFCPDQLYMYNIYSALAPASAAKLTGWNFATSRRGVYSNPPCASTPSSWLGVTCTNSKVTALNLGGLGLSGKLSPSIGEMTGLTAINVSANSLGGRIPYQLGLLTALTSLRLNANAFSSACIPTALTSTGVIVVADAYVPTCGNDMAALAKIYTATGKSPDITWSFAKNSANAYINDCCNPGAQAPSSCVFIQCSGVRVQAIGMSAAGFSSPASYLAGTLPSEIGLLDKVSIFDVNSHPLLRGSIPSAIGKMTNLASVQMYNCGITGSLPSSIGQLSQLLSLSLFGNPMSGTMPREVGLLSQMANFSPPYRAFTGPISLTFNAMYQVLNFNPLPMTGCLPATMFSYATVQQPLCKDQDALLEIFTQLGPAVQALLTDWNFATNNVGTFTSPVCPVSGAASTWAGVTCTAGMVTGLSFNNMGLSSFPFYALASMPALTTFSANKNALAGTIPSYLFQVVGGLTGLDLNSNALTGSIPESFFALQNMVNLDLSSNRLTSSISKFIAQMPSLVSVRLDNNLFSGPVPNVLEMAPSLATLTLSSNKFLSSVCLSSNLQTRPGLAVTTDSSIVGCQDQDYLLLLMAAFKNPNTLTNWNSAVVSGAYSRPPCASTPSSWLGITCKGGKVTSLSLRGLDIAGSIASAIGGLASLTSLDLSQPATGAGFSGTIPIQVGLLSALTSLDMSSNKNLTGCLPPSLVRAGLKIVTTPYVSTCTFPDMAGLQGLYTAFNSPSVLKWSFALNRVGIPSNGGVCNCVSPQCDSTRLWSSNLISCSGGRVIGIKANSTSWGGNVGSLPSSLGLMNKLASLNITNMGAWLVGTIPAEIGRASSLMGIDVYNSTLTGQIPSSIGLLTNLKRFHAGGCELSGTLPRQMGNLPLLNLLALKGNKDLSGTIPLTFNSLVQCSLEQGCTLDLPWTQLSADCYPYAIARFAGVKPLCTPQDMLKEMYTAMGSPAVLQNGGWNFAKTTPLVYTQPVCPVCSARNQPACASSWVGITCNYVSGVGANTVVGIALSGLNLPQGLLPLYALNGMRISNIDLSSNSFSGPLPYYYAYLGDGVNPVSIKLDSNMISGTLPATLAQTTQMKSLQSFSAANNQLVGSLPSNMQSLTSLALFDVHGCSLTGTIPLTFFRSLPSTTARYIDLSDNYLVGSIPPTLGNMQGLSFLSIAANSLSGQVPSQIGQLLLLNYLDLSQNQLAGSLPRPISYLAHLSTLRLGFTSLTGPIPLALCSLRTNATIDFVGSAGITCVPSCLFASFPAFTSDTASACVQNDIDYMGVLAASFIAGGSTDNNLASWDVAANNLCSGWPYVTCSANGLVSSITLFNNNKIRGTLPTAIGMLSGLKSLNISGTEMFGSLPSTLGNLFALTSISLSRSDFSGSMPLTLGQLTGLKSLDLSNNDLNSVIPASLAGLVSLGSLLLSGNSLGGTVPAALGIISTLQDFVVDGNLLTGVIPDSFANLVALRTLVVDGNMLTGAIPDMCLPTLIAGRVSLTGNKFRCYPACLGPTASFSNNPYVLACPPTGLPASYLPSTSLTMPRTNNLLGTILVPEMYSLSFTINPRSNATALSNVLHLGSHGQAQSSSYLPAVYQDVDGKLLLYYQDAGLSTRYQVATTRPIPLNQDSIVTITVDVFNRVVSMGIAGSINLPAVSVSIPSAKQVAKNVDVLFSDSLSPAAKTIVNLAVVEQLSYPQTAFFLPTQTMSLTTATLLGYVSLPQQFVISFDVLRGASDTAWSMLTLWPYGGAAGPTTLSGLPNLMTGASCNYNCTTLRGPNGAAAASGQGAGVPVNKWVTLWVTLDLTSGDATWQSSDGWTRQTTSPLFTGFFPSVQVWASNPNSPAPALSFIRNVVLSAQPVGGMSLLQFGQGQAVEAQVWEGCDAQVTCAVTAFGPIRDLHSINDDYTLNLDWTDPLSYIQFSYSAEVDGSGAVEQNPWTAMQYDSEGTSLRLIGNGVISVMDKQGLYFFFTFIPPAEGSIASGSQRTGILFSVSTILSQVQHDTTVSFSGTSKPTKTQVDSFATQYGPQGTIAANLFSPSPAPFLALPLVSSISASTGARNVNISATGSPAVTFPIFYPGAYFANSLTGAATNALLYSLPANAFALPLSLSFWVRFEDLTGSYTAPVVLGSASAWGVAVFRNTDAIPSGLLTVDCWAASGVRVRSVSPVRPALHVWYHVAVTIAPGLTQRLYINGALAAATATTTTTTSYSTVVANTGAPLSSNLRLGQSWLGPNTATEQYNFQGYLMDLRLFSLQLNDAQVAAIYSSSTPRGDTVPTAQPTNYPSPAPTVEPT